MRVGGTVVLHEPESGRYVKLNASAAELWTFLEEPVSLAELSAQFAARHRIAIERSDADVRIALEHLIERGLARASVRDAGAAG